MWPVSADRRGTTLAELLVYSLLFLFVLGFVYGCLAMGLDAYRRTENFAVVQQQAMTAIHTMTDELASSPKAMVLLEAGPPAGSVVYLSARDAGGVVRYNDGGRPLWQAWVAWHLDPGGAGLVRTEKAIAPTAALPETIPTAAALAADATASHRQVAPTAESLQFTSGTAIEVHLVAANDLRGRTSFEVRDRVWFRR